MILFPAIDLKDGLAVRLQQGDMARATVFNRDPAAQAQAFERQGFEYLHLVDLDGAFAFCNGVMHFPLKVVGPTQKRVRFGGRVEIQRRLVEFHRALVVAFHLRLICILEHFPSA